MHTCLLCLVLFWLYHEFPMNSWHLFTPHYNDVIMDAMASQITSLTIVYSTMYSGADQRKQLWSSAPLVFVWGIHWSPVNSPHRSPVTRKCFHLMTSLWKKTEIFHDINFVITGDTGGCRYDNLRCRQWRKVSLSFQWNDLFVLSWWYHEFAVSSCDCSASLAILKLPRCQWFNPEGYG